MADDHPSLRITLVYPSVPTSHLASYTQPKPQAKNQPKQHLSPRSSLASNHGRGSDGLWVRPARPRRRGGGADLVPGGHRQGFPQPRASRLLPSPSPRTARPPPLGDLADQSVSRFHRVINILDCTGHTRFRRGPIGATIVSTPPPSPSPAPTFSQPTHQKSLMLDFTKSSKALVVALVTSTSFFLSVMAGGDDSLSKCQSQLVSSDEPPLVAGTEHKQQQPC